MLPLQGRARLRGRSLAALLRVGGSPAVLGARARPPDPPTTHPPPPPAPLSPQLVELVADPALSPLFSAAEVAELLQFERAAVVLQMRNEEQAAAAAAAAGGGGAAQRQPGMEEEEQAEEQGAQQAAGGGPQ